METEALFYSSLAAGVGALGMVGLIWYNSRVRLTASQDMELQQRVKNQLDSLDALDDIVVLHWCMKIRIYLFSAQK